MDPVVWAYGKDLKPSDPINIIFDEIPLKEIETYLQNKGWSSPHVADDLYIPKPDILNPAKQDKQLIYKPGAWSIRRVHVRLWDYKPGSVLASVHHELLSFPTHEVMDFETAEEFLANVCRNNGNWQVTEENLRDSNYFANYKQPYNNGKVTKIKRR